MATAAVLTVAPGNGAAEPVHAQSYGGGGRCGDFNHDGAAELLVQPRTGLSSGGKFLRLWQREDGRFGRSNEFFELVHGMENVRWFGAGDFDHDGWADLATVTKSGELRISLNTQNFKYGKVLGPFRTVVTGLGSRDIVFTADADGDGYDDLIARRAGTNVTELYRNMAVDGGAFAAPQRYLSTASGVVAQTVADVTLDGKPDVLSVTRDGRLHLRDLATGGAGTSYLLGGGWQTVRDLVINDMNDDGAPDILGRRAGFSDRVIAYSHAGTFRGSAPGATYGSPYTVYVDEEPLDGIG